VEQEVGGVSHDTQSVLYLHKTVLGR
jgi:hypothetical protein